MADNDDYGGLLPPTITWALLAAGLFAVSYVILILIGWPDQALLTGISLASLTFSTRIYWNFRAKRWFQVCSGIAFTLHLIPIISVHLPKSNVHVPVIAFIFPAMVVDFMLVISAYWWVKSTFSNVREVR